MFDSIAITFFVLYAGAVVAIWVTVVLRRPPRARLDPDRLSGLDEYEVAMINGEEPLVAATALLNLDRLGSVELSDSLLRYVAESNDIVISDLTPEKLSDLGVSNSVMLLRDPPPVAHPVELGVYEAARHLDPRTPQSVIEAATTAPQLAELRERLAGDGLVWTEAQKIRFPRQWRWFLLLFVAGLGGLVVGLVGCAPAGVNLGLTGLVGTTGAVMLPLRQQRAPMAPRRRLLAQLGAKGREAVEGWTAGLRDAMALALVGPAGLWDVDRPLALALGAVAAPPKPGGGGCGGCGGCGGGCGGC